MVVVSAKVNNEDFTGVIKSVFLKREAVELSTFGRELEVLPNHNRGVELFIEFYVTEELVKKYNLPKRLIRESARANEMLLWELPCSSAVFIDYDGNTTTIECL